MTSLLSLAIAMFAGLMMTRAVKRLHLPDVTAYLKRIAQPGDIILTMGAGDIFRAGEALLKDQEEG